MVGCNPSILGHYHLDFREACKLLSPLPDQIYIDRIRERLWCGRDIGQASVMIGAGFSRNAIKVTPSSPEFPLWYQLADELKNRLQSRASSDALRLASEYEVVFGRQNLDDLLISLIPDLQYQPGKLHKLLLSLPWSDIFTTNYDTLLERTTPLIYDRKFDVVLTHSDLPGRMKPRIVKLHGSFPSHRPFIFTEEDYRTYPKKFAPFVNTVQQSIMENILCLIGFSGDDPNFLNWIGWVRDNLGTSTPPIYLCGVLNLSISQRKLLETKNVTTIDLSPIFPEADFPDRNIRHARSIEWFLLNLMQGQPNNLEWPNPPVVRDLKEWEPSIDLPSLPRIKFTTDTWQDLNTHNSYNRSFDNYHSIDNNEIKDLIKNWKLCREAYPNFIICPLQSRNQLWRSTDKWISRLVRTEALQNSQILDEIECLSILYELNWRIEKCLMPLYSQILASIDRVLAEINPFSKLLDYELNSSVITPEFKDKKDSKIPINWSEVRNQWMFLAFVIIKEARREREYEKFARWILSIEPIVKLDLEWQSRWFYEQCLFELVSFNKSKLVQLLDEWQSLKPSSIWMVKISGILFEIGERIKSEEIAKQALTDIRSRLRPYTNDYSSLAQEGIAMMLLEIIERSNDYNKIFEHQSNQNRWNILTTYQCNPWTELAGMQETCKGNPPQPKPHKEDFDPGYSSTSYRAGSESILSELRPGFELFIMIEEIGISPVMLNSSLPKAVQWIEPYYPLWGIEILIRCQNEAEIKEYFNSVSIENLDESNVKILYDWLNSKLHESIKRIKANRYSEDYRDNAWTSFNTSLEILSRILSRISDEQSRQLFSVVINCLADLQDRQLVQMADTIQSFWRRVFERNSNIDTLNSIESLLKIPLTDVQSFENNKLDPFVHIKWKNNFLLPKGFDRDRWNVEIVKLIDNVNHNDSLTREYSLVRLLTLIDINALRDQEEKSLASALWSQLDDAGLPLIEFKCLRKNALLHFPEPEVYKNRTVDLLKQHILSRELPTLSINSLSDIVSYLDLWHICTSPLLLQTFCTVNPRITWTSEELKILSKKLLNLIENGIETLKSQNRDTFFGDTSTPILSRTVAIVTFLIVPSWQSIDNDTKEIVLKLVNIIRDLEYSKPRLSLCLAMIDSYDLQLLSEEIKEQIYSSNLDAIDDAIWGIYSWIIYYKSDLPVPEPPSELIDIMISLFIARRQPGFNGYIESIVNLIMVIPDLLNLSQLGNLISGIRYILNETDSTKQENRDESIIPPKKYREYRGLAYRMAHQLDLIYSIRFPDSYPSLINQWKEASLNETWAENKSLWKDE